MSRERRSRPYRSFPMEMQHIGLPLPGAWETLTLLALSTAAAAALLFCADAARRRRSPLPGNAARPWLAHAAGCALLGLAGLFIGLGPTPQLPTLRSQTAGWSPEGMACAGALLICALAGLWRCRREDVRPGWGVVLPLALAAAATVAAVPQALRLCLLQGFSLPPLWPLYLALAGLSAACGMAALRQGAASPLSLDAARLRVLCGMAALACALAGVLVTPAAAVSTALGWRAPDYAATVCAMTALFCWRWPRLAPLCGGMALLAGLFLLWKVLFLRQAVTAATDGAQQMALVLRLFQPGNLIALAIGVIFCAVCVFLVERLLRAAPTEA